MILARVYYRRFCAGRDSDGASSYQRRRRTRHSYNSIRNLAVKSVKRPDTDGIAWNGSFLFRYHKTFAALVAWETSCWVAGPERSSTDDSGTLYWKVICERDIYNCICVRRRQYRLTSSVLETTLLAD